MTARPSKRKSVPANYVNIKAQSWAETLRSVPKGPKALLLFLARKADAHGCSYYKKAQMANDLGCSPRTVQYHLRALENYGLIRTIGRCANFAQISNVYHVIGWMGREQLPPGGHKTLGKYVTEPSPAEFSAALGKQNLLLKPAKSAHHNYNTELITTSAEEDVLEECIAALGSWITLQEQDLLREDCLSLFHLIEHGYGIGAHILPVLRKKTATRRKARLIRTWDYFAEAIAEFAETVDKDLEKVFRKVPQPKQVRADAKEEEQRAAIQRILDSVKRTAPDAGLAGGSE
jgi:DNA-binding Lrp family transcriptional regulator